MTDDPLPAPEVGAVPRWLTLHPGIRTAWRIGTAIATPLVGIACAALARALEEAVALPIPWWTIGLLAAPLFFAANWWFSGRRYAAWRYVLSADDLAVEHGVFWRLARTIPRVRIQHVDVHSGPLDRALGLAQLSIYTAGSEGAVETIPGLAPATADGLRDALLGLSARP